MYNYFNKPFTKRATIIESIRCLFNPNRVTWLRVDSNYEDKLFKYLDRFIFFTLGALLITIFFAIHQYNTYKDERGRIEGPGYTIILKDDGNINIPNLEQTR
jgi:hypothetical protein